MPDTRMTNSSREKDLSESFAHRAIHPLVERPSRYADCELNLAGEGFVEGGCNVLLVFPDAYEIGASHQGIRFLHDRLAALPGVGVEFAFAPWPDAERLMRATGEPLRSLRTGTPARRFDVVGFSVTYELHYSNVLMMLDLAGVPLEKGGRGEDDPVVIAGGPCCSNPFPMIEAIDAVFLGDAEDSLVEAATALAALKASGAPRRERTAALARIEGVYVDGVSGAARARTHRFAPDDLPRRPIVPVSDIVHQRLSIEVMRGCARGCRFCHAGMFYRPCRERGVEEIVAAAREGLAATGWDEVSLLSLSTSDYSRLDELLARLAPELERLRVSLALPSLRPETITRGIVSASAAVTRSGFTIAPEAGTERLRRVIRKDFSDGEILEGARRILEGGWQNLKLYFMIGLPTETEDDIAGIARLVDRILELPRRRGRFNLSVSISPFVPKPHTPFQWERQDTIEEMRAKERLLAGLVRSRFVSLSQRDPAVSALEGALARGDRRLWPAIRRAYELGCRFDGWVDRLRFDLWERAFAECGCPIGELGSARPVEGPLPWDVLELHGTKGFLAKERELAYAQAAGGPRLSGGGGDAAAAPGSVEAPAARVEAPAAEAPPPGAEAGRAVSRVQEQPAHFRYRIVYEKRGRVRFLSHIDTLNVIQRALRRSGLPIAFSEGFHPHPRFSAGPSLAVGMEGLREFFDVELLAPVKPAPGVLNAAFPEGMRALSSAGPFTRRGGKLPAEALYRYRIDFGTIRRLLAALEADVPGGAEVRTEGLSPQRRMWYLLARELGIADAPELFECGAPVDPAAASAARWRRAFDDGAALPGARGAERSCRGCSIEAANGETIDLSLPAGGPRPQDLLAIAMPKNVVPLAGILRLEILYKLEATWVGAEDLVGAR